MLRQSRPAVALLTFVEVDDAAERQRLEALHGQVFSTQEFCERFQLLLCMRPYCVVKDRLTRKDGLLQFPRDGRDISLTTRRVRQAKSPKKTHPNGESKEAMLICPHVDGR